MDAYWADWASVGSGVCGFTHDWFWLVSGQQQHAHECVEDVSREVVNFVDLTATWLILPVVICLSQRLSHACLSIAGNSEAANSSLQQPLFLGSTLYLDNCGNSRANTCIKTRRKDGRIY
jgi:hypothetical protein